MSFTRKALVAGLLMLAPIAPVFASATDTGSAVICTKSGQTMVVPITPERQSELLASNHARPLDKDVVVLVSGGKTYVVDEHVMASGKGMIASILSDFTPGQGGG